MGTRRVTKSGLLKRVENNLLKSASGSSKFIGVLDSPSIELQSLNLE